MEEQYKNCTIEITQDEAEGDPRENSDRYTQMICFHKRYTLGDRHSYNSDDYSGWAELEKSIRTSQSDIILPLYLYDHSGLRMKIGSFYGLLPQGHAEFDSGQVGFIIFTAEKMRECFGKKRITDKTIKRAVKLMEGEVEEYDQYLSGDVYCVSAIDENGETIDSCCGYYGYEYALEAGQEMIDSYIRIKNEKKQEKAKAYIKNKVPLEKRIYG